MKKSSVIAVAAAVLIVVFLFAAYNLFRFPAAFRNLSDESLGGAEVTALKEEIAAREDKNVLVAYFSYSGTTRGVAEALSSRIGADLFEISPAEDYSNLYIQSNSEVRSGARPELSGTVENMADYDIVFVGYPVWFHATPAPVNSFLESYDLTGKLIIPFCTSGGSDIDETMPTFLDSCSGLAVYGEKRISSSSQIDEWLAELDLNLTPQDAGDSSLNMRTDYEYEVQDLYAQRGEM